MSGSGPVQPGSGPPIWSWFFGLLVVAFLVLLIGCSVLYRLSPCC